MSTEIDIRPVLRSLLESQRFAALATDDHGQPFASLMAFAATEDLRHLVGPCPRFLDTVVDYAADGSVAAWLVS